MLESALYPLVESSSGKEALTAVEKASFQLMTLDLSMPDMDGFDVLRTSDHPETTHDGYHPYAATFPARGVAPAGADGLLASAPHVPGLLLRALSLPTYSSTESEATGELLAGTPHVEIEILLPT
jgi:CheY-like chemotaxis protein